MIYAIFKVRIRHGKIMWNWAIVMIWVYDSKQYKMLFHSNCWDNASIRISNCCKLMYIENAVNTKTKQTKKCSTKSSQYFISDKSGSYLLQTENVWNFNKWNKYHFEVQNTDGNRRGHGKNSFVETSLYIWPGIWRIEHTALALSKVVE